MRLDRMTVRVPSTKSRLMNVVVSAPMTGGTNLWVQLHLRTVSVEMCGIPDPSGARNCCRVNHLQSLSSHTAGATTPEPTAQERSGSCLPRVERTHPSHKTEPSTMSEKVFTMPRPCPKQKTSEHPRELRQETLPTSKHCGLDARERCSRWDLYELFHNEVLSHQRPGE